ncbi:MAG: ABC transporter ATP-binding protein [Gammaproteobacteria bacterium]|nr:ABC transporter ATP-binding protein [Gammaproteobacteria bacterium]
MLEIRGLRAGYGRIPILHGIDLSVADGETVGILGHNGMGKSTLMKAAMGLVRPTGGTVEFQGEDITQSAPFQRARMGLGYVPQGREIFPGITVLENLRMGACTRGGEEAQVVDRVLEELPRLKPLLDRLGGELSGGEQQILAVARCLCGEPRLVLLDEPTEGIQPSIIDLIVDTLRRLGERRGLGFILVEQNLDFIAALCARVFIIQRGRITREISPSQLADAELVSEFVGSSH